MENVNRTRTVEKKSKIKKLLFPGAIILFAMGYWMLSPVRAYKKIPVYQGSFHMRVSAPQIDHNKKNILIIADNKGTEIFDLIAPFYLFSLTQKANVLIAAEKKYPVSVMKGFFTLPHYTFREIDSLNLHADAIVIPNHSGTDRNKQDHSLLHWITTKASDSTKILSVCAGSVTGAATGLYDGKKMTTHASELEANKRQFKNNVWLDGVTYTKEGNLYSTAGVSNAVEGTLALIEDLFGTPVMRSVMDSIHYPHVNLETRHSSLAIGLQQKAALLRKVLFRNDPNIGVLLEEHIDEFWLAAILDSYHRTVPSSLKTYSMDQKPVSSKFGLVMIPTGDASGLLTLDELHIVGKKGLSRGFETIPDETLLVDYDKEQKQYIFDLCLKRIQTEYGNGLQTAVKRLLDYN